MNISITADTVVVTGTIHTTSEFMVVWSLFMIALYVLFSIGPKLGRIADALNRAYPEEK